MWGTNIKLKITEKGFTLIELLVAMSIAALVVSAASMTIITMMRLSPKSTEWAIALRQVQNAGHLISRDVLMSQTIVVDSDPGTPTFLTLTQPQITPPDKTIVYQLQDMPDGGQRLMRDDTGGQPVMIAQYLSVASAEYYSDNGTLILTIEATYGEAAVERTYETMQRVPP
ncbi:MAG: type II secretion system protein [Chloroflexi bacterium]|nr:type II secretion system protein [Chloroflexota bacterium]